MIPMAVNEREQLERSLKMCLKRLQRARREHDQIVEATAEGDLNAMLERLAELTEKAA